MTVRMKKRVLIAEYDSTQRFSLEKCLHRMNLEIVSTDNGKDAIDLLLANPRTDLIISDIMLPEMSGIELRKAQLQHPEVKHIPIIFLTNHLDHAETIGELSPKLVLVKPVVEDDMIKIMENFL